MDNAWATKEPEGHVFDATPEGFKKRCYTFLYILCNDKDMKMAGAYLAPDCVLVHEDNPPVKGSEGFLTTWGKTLKAMPGYHKDMQDMMVELGQEPNGVARVWVYSRISGITPNVVRDSVDIMHFTHDGLFLYSKDVQRDTKPAQ
jgi:SnoaL-like domain